MKLEDLMLEKLRLISIFGRTEWTFFWKVVISLTQEKFSQGLDKHLWLI